MYPHAVMTQCKNAFSSLTFALIVAYTASNSISARADTLVEAEACKILFDRKPTPGNKVSEVVTLFLLAVVHERLESLGPTQIDWKIAYRRIINDIFSKVQH